MFAIPEYAAEYKRGQRLSVGNVQILYTLATQDARSPSSALTTIHFGRTRAPKTHATRLTRQMPPSKKAKGKQPSLAAAGVFPMLSKMSMAIGCSASCPARSGRGGVPGSRQEKEVQVHQHRVRRDAHVLVQGDGREWRGQP